MAFHKLTISKVQKETEDTVSVSFNVPSGLKDRFVFKAGQYLTLKVYVNGQYLNRSYSLCSCPISDEDVTVAVKRVENGKVSNEINDNFKAGMEVEVMEPMGNFFLAPEASNAKHYILFGAGSGITPLMSILSALMKKEPNSKATLFYGNKTEQSTIFRDRLNGLVSDRFKLVNVLSRADGSWTGYTGRIDKETALKLIRENTDLSFANAEFYMCGPSGMMASVNDALDTLGISKEKINREYFTAKEAGDEAESASVGDAIEEELKGKTSVKIIYDGDEYEFEASPKDLLLEAALDAGYDPPYSCMVAACCTCRAKLQGGKVEMEDRESLTDEEIEEGFVLTCQAKPRSHGIVLNYDV